MLQATHSNQVSPTVPRVCRNYLDARIPAAKTWALAQTQATIRRDNTAFDVGRHMCAYRLQTLGPSLAHLGFTNFDGQGWVDAAGPHSDRRARAGG